MSRIGKVIAGISIMAGAFGYGAAVGAFELFPYAWASAGWKAVHGLLDPAARGPSRDRILDTSLLPFTVSRHTIPGETPSNPRGGGALAGIDAWVVGVDRWGRFFSFDGDSEVRVLDITLDTGIEALRRMTADSAQLAERGLDVRDLRRRGLDLDDPSSFNLRSFRFLDLALCQNERELDLFVSYYVWHQRESCKAVRLSRTRIEDPERLYHGRLAVQADDWETVFETRPCLPFSYRNNSPFQSPNSGGRLVPLPDGRLLFSIGDHHLDGWNNPDRAPQDSSSSYGTILAVHPESGTAEIVALGVRNPQGLVLDHSGRIWETEHGPRGGDELNQILFGENYGWPLTTLGVQYDTYDWPLNTSQGRHDGFRRPVFAWLPSIGVSNLVAIHEEPSQWKNDLLVSSLVAGSLFRVRMAGDAVILVERIPVGERVRDLVHLPGGRIVLWTDANELVRLEPRSPR